MDIIIQPSLFFASLKKGSVPVNYLSLQDQIKKYGESAAGQKLEFEQKFNACLSLLKNKPAT